MGDTFKNINNSEIFSRSKINVTSSFTKKSKKDAYLKIDELKRRIANNEIKEVLFDLTIIFKEMPNKLNEVITIMSNYNELQSECRKGIISNEEADVKRTKWKYAILELIDQYYDIIV